MKTQLPVLLMLCAVAYNQIGVNTETPQKTLHINGDLQITYTILP